MPPTSFGSAEVDGQHAHRSPAVGRTVEDHIAEGSTNLEERAEFERLVPFEEIARLVIMRRAELGISQADLARRMKAPRSVVSRIESGQHATSSRTMKRLAEALKGRAVIGFEFNSAHPDFVRL